MATLTATATDGAGDTLELLRRDIASDMKSRFAALGITDGITWTPEGVPNLIAVLPDVTAAQANAAATRARNFGTNRGIAVTTVVA